MASWRSFLFSYARRSRTIGLAITLALGGATLAAPGGCTLNTEGLATGGSSASATTTTTTTTSTTAASTSTGVAECTVDVDCGVAPPGSCKKKVCSSFMCADVTDLTNTPPDDMKSCIAELCSGDGNPYYLAIPAGMPCQGTTGVCDGAGACVICASDKDCPAGMELTCDPGTHSCIGCSDGVQNGKETGIDCGGSCKGCKGDPCSGPTGCLSGNCADKVCCDTACNGTCKSCDAPGSLGTCIDTPFGHPDLTCGGTNACDGTGTCKVAAGAPCGNNSACASGICFASRCRLPTGSKCDDDALCVSGLCANAVCTACSANSQCKSNLCDMPNCKSPGGALCEKNTDCAGGSCQSSFCLLNNGSACLVSTDCKSGVCGGGMCVPCTNDSNCSGGAKCNGVFDPGTCSLPTNAYCYSDTYCPPGTTCQGQPDKCK